MEIKVENLNKKICDIYILKNINLCLTSGSVNVIIGPNGAGKTSLLRQLVLLDKPCSGEIYYDGFPVSKMTNFQKTVLRRKIGFVFQHPVMLNGSVYDNIIYGLKIRGIEIEKNKIEKILIKVGLFNKIYLDAKKLSGGEKQRLSIARTLILEPEQIFFDEPTVNLDPVSTRTIETLISELSEMKKTVVLSTHNLRQARQFGKKIFFMKSGEILQEGNSEDIFNSPTIPDIAEYSFTGNIIRGKILSENGQTYLYTDNLKISVVTENIYNEVIGVLRPDDIFVSKLPFESSARNCFNGIITKIEYLGNIYILTVNVNGTELETVITKQSLISMNLNKGDEVYLTFKATAVHLLKQYDRI